MSMVKDPMARHRFEVEAQRTRETADKITRDAREAFNALVIDEPTYRRIVTSATEYLNGTLALLRKVYEMES